MKNFLIFYRMGDTYSALRDYLYLIQHCPNEVKVHIGLIKCLVTLKWSKEANDWAKYALTKFYELKTSQDYIDLSGTIKFLLSDKPGEDHYGTDHQEQVLRQNSIDYRSRYVGHCNTTTDIKEANFLGEF